MVAGAACETATTAVPLTQRLAPTMLSLMLSLYGFSTYPRASETEDVVASAANAINDLAVPERMTYASISGPSTRQDVKDLQKCTGFKTGDVGGLCPAGTVPVTDIGQCIDFVDCNGWMLDQVDGRNTKVHVGKASYLGVPPGCYLWDQEGMVFSDTGSADRTGLIAWFSPETHLGKAEPKSTPVCRYSDPQERMVELLEQLVSLQRVHDDPSTGPQATDPSSTDPPATDPSSTDPLATEPPATEPLFPSFYDGAELKRAIDAAMKSWNEANPTTTYASFDRWDVSRVEDFSGAFNYEREQIIRTPQIQNWDVSKGKNFNGMVRGVTSQCTPARARRRRLAQRPRPRPPRRSLGERKSSTPTSGRGTCPRAPTSGKWCASPGPAAYRGGTPSQAAHPRGWLWGCHFAHHRRVRARRVAVLQRPNFRPLPLHVGCVQREELRRHGARRPDPQRQLAKQRARAGSRRSSDPAFSLAAADARAPRHSFAGRIASTPTPRSTGLGI